MFPKSFRHLSLPICFLAVTAIVAGTAHAADNHAKDCASALPIEPSGQVTTAFKDTLDVAVYRIKLPQRGLLDVWMDPPNNFDVAGMELLDMSCKPIRTVNGGVSVVSGDYARLTIPSTDIFSNQTISTLSMGLYFIQIMPDATTVYGDPFTLHTRFTPHWGHDFATAEPLNLDGAIKGTLLYAEDREVFRVEVKDPGELSATVKTSAAHDPKLGLYFADCNSAAGKLRENRDKKSNTMSTFTLVPGTYYVTVDPDSPLDIGDFILSVRFNPKTPTLTDPVIPKGICGQ